MTTKCQVCEGHTQTRLCVTHELILRDTLKELPQWLEWLADAATGNVRLNTHTRHGTRAGDFDEFIGPDDEANSERLTRALRDNRFNQDRVLAAGRINAKASRLHQKAIEDITFWVKHICDTHGLGYLGATTDITTHTRWLEKNTHAIARDEKAKEAHDTFVDLVDHIRHTINRPHPPRFCGPCPTKLTEQQRTKLANLGKEDRETCAIRLYAKPRTHRVKCPECHTEHDVKGLSAHWYDQCGDNLFTIRELVDWVLPQLGEPVSQQWLYKWAKTGELPVAGYAANGDIMLRLRDVRHLRDNPPQRARGKNHKHVITC